MILPRPQYRFFAGAKRAVLYVGWSQDAQCRRLCKNANLGLPQPPLSYEVQILHECQKAKRDSPVLKFSRSKLEYKQQKS